MIKWSPPNFKSFPVSVLVAHGTLNNHCPAFGEVSLTSTLDEQSRGFGYCKNDILCSDQDLRQSELLVFLMFECHQFCWPNGRLLLSSVSSWNGIFRVHWLSKNERRHYLKQFFCTLPASSRSSYCIWCSILSSFICISSSSFLYSNFDCSSWNFVSSSISKIFILSSRFVSIIIFKKNFPYPDRLLLLPSAKFEQLNSPSDSCYPRFCSLFDCCCVALRLLLVARLRLVMQANESPKLLCTPLLALDVLWKILLGGMKFCFALQLLEYFFLWKLGSLLNW